jgi:hypothetical protein
VADFVAKVSVRSQYYENRASYNYIEWEDTHKTLIANQEHAMMERCLGEQFDCQTGTWNLLFVVLK